MFSVVEMDTDLLGSLQTSSSSTSSNLDIESDRHNKEMSNIELDFQRVAISGEDHSGVSYLPLCFNCKHINSALWLQRKSFGTIVEVRYPYLTYRNHLRLGLIF